MEKFVKEYLDRVEMYDDDPFLLKVVKWCFGIILLCIIMPIHFLYLPVRAFGGMTSAIVRLYGYYSLIFIFLGILFNTALFGKLFEGVVCGTISGIITGYYYSKIYR
jgi:hypothetical protein